MLIREAGILFHGIPIAFNSFNKDCEIKSNNVCTSGLLRKLSIFSKFLTTQIEYFESQNHSIILKEGIIKDIHGVNQNILAFIILEKDYRLEKYLGKIIFPLLEKLLYEFISQYYGYDLFKLGQFKVFKSAIKKIVALRPA